MSFPGADSYLWQFSAVWTKPGLGTLACLDPYRIDRRTVGVVHARIAPISSACHHQHHPVQSLDPIDSRALIENVRLRGAHYSLCHCLLLTSSNSIPRRRALHVEHPTPSILTIATLRPNQWGLRQRLAPKPSRTCLPGCGNDLNASRRQAPSP